MRASILLTLALIALPTASWAAPPLNVLVGHHHGRAVHLGQAERYLLREHILTPAQLACSSLVRGPLGSARVSRVSVFETHGGRCPGDIQPPTYLFDLYVDRVSGVIDYTPEDHADLQTILPPIPVGR